MTGRWMVLAAVAVVAAACASIPAEESLQTEETATPPSLPPTAAPQTGTWEVLDVTVAVGAEAVWTGADVLVFHRADPAPEHAHVVRLDVESGTVTDTSPDRGSIISSIASKWTWTGRALVVWDVVQTSPEAIEAGEVATYEPQGVLYDAASQTWRRFAGEPLQIATPRPHPGFDGVPLETATPPPHIGVAAEAVDGEILVWSHGVAFDPVGGASRVVAIAPLVPRVHAVAARTVEQLLLWSGEGGGDGAAYDPATDSWTRIAPAPPGAEQRVGAWTGTEALLWDGTAGAAYDPALDTWRTLPEAPAHGTVAVWSGTELLLAAGAAYDPATDGWRTLPPPPLPVADQVTAVWTGEAMVVLGTTGTAIYRPSMHASSDADTS